MKTMSKSILIIVLLALALSCSNEQNEFKVADEVGTAAAYQNFLDKHPKGELAERARFLYDSLTTLHGGCSAQMGDISEKLLGDLNKIEEYSQSADYMKMISSLWDLVVKDSTLKTNARPVIQRILKSAADTSNYTGVTNYEESIFKFVDYYADSSNFPEFSYEALLCQQIHFSFLLTQRELFAAKLDRSKMMNSFTSMFNQWINSGESVYSFQNRANNMQANWYATRIVYDALVEKVSSLRKETVYLIQEYNLDVCAKNQYWNFMEAMLSDGLYGSQFEPFESNKAYVFFLKDQMKKERNEIVLESAKRVLTKIHVFETEEAEKKLASIFAKNKDIDSQDEKGRTALINEALNGRLITVKALIDSNANLNIKDNDGWTALMWSILEGYEPISELLIENGADVDIFTASMLGDTSKVSLLIDSSGVNMKTNDGWTPLYAAVHSKKPEMIKYLIRKGADVNQIVGKYTPLMYAILLGNEEIVEILIRNNADIKIKNNNGDTAISLAKKSSNKKILDLLGVKI